jgi:hypothetical protein
MLPHLKKRTMLNLGKCSEEYLNADAYLSNPQILRNIFAHKDFELWINDNKEVMVYGTQWKKGKEDEVEFLFSMNQINNLNSELELVSKDNDEFFHKKIKMHANKPYNALYTCLVSNRYLAVSDYFSRYSDDEIGKRIENYNQGHEGKITDQRDFERKTKEMASIERSYIIGTELGHFIKNLLLEKTKDGKKKISLYDKEKQAAKNFDEVKDITYQDFVFAVRAIRNGVLHKNISKFYEQDGDDMFEIFDYAYTGKKWLKCKGDREYLSKHEMNLSGKELLKFAKLIVNFEIGIEREERILERTPGCEVPISKSHYDDEIEM